MKKVNLLLILAIQILFVLPSFSQELFIRDVIAKPSKMVSSNTKSGDTQDDYQQERQIIDEYLKQINSNFSAGDIKIIIDSRNVKHFRFDILYNNIIVDGHKLTLHPLSDTTMYVKGMNLFCDNIVTTPSITEEQAIEKLKFENNLIIDEFILSSELVIHKALKGFPCLSYKIKVRISTEECYYYYVSAINGDILRKKSLIHNYVSANGIAELENWGEQNIETSFDNQIAKYILFDQTANIHTYDLKRKRNKSQAVNIFDTDNYWSMIEFAETDTNSLNAPLVAQWSARQIYNFFKIKFNRMGYNENNALLEVYTNYGTIASASDAFWDDGDNAIFLGAGYPFLDIARPHHYSVLDIIAHEYGHAITSYSANLLYEGESGAINESLSDIWAACVENYLGSSSYEIWNMGNHMDSVDRCLSDPNSKYQPDTYGGLYWKDPTNLNDYDNGGVHTNSGVMNYWFYLLVNGGAGTNDNNESYNIQGIGFQKAQHIIYDALMEHLDAESDFADTRQATINATIDLYGEHSNEHKQVENAWHAVGVGAPYIGQIMGEYGVCENGIYYMSYLHPATSITWSVDKFTNAFHNLQPKINITSGQNTNTITVEKVPTGLVAPSGEIYFYNGNVTLTATISYKNNTYTRQKNLFTNTPLPTINYTITQGSSFSTTNEYKFYVNNVAASHLNWRVEFGNNIYTATSQNNIVVNLPKIIRQDIIVSVIDNGGCSSTNYQTLTLKGIIIPPSPIFSHENPITPNSTLLIKKEFEEIDNDVIYRIEIWDENTLVISENYVNTSEFIISTENLISGVYFIRIYRNGEFLDTQKLIVK